MAAKNAELQEKIVHVQSNLAEVKEEKERESLANYQFEEKMKENIVSLERTVEVSERTRSDRKQEFIESIRELVNDEDIAEHILEIENQLTVLEEEKGNLQMRLVDFDDIVTSEKLTKSELNEVSSKFKNLTTELSDSNVDLEAKRKQNEDLIKAVEG